MKCRKAKVYIHQEIDGELSNRQQAALQQHLASCVSCRALQRQLVSIRAAMHDLAITSEDLVPSHRDSSPIPIDFGAPRTTPWRSGFSIAAAVMVLLVGVWAWSAFLQPDGVAPKARQLAERPVEQQPVIAEIPKDQPAEVLHKRLVQFDLKSRVRVRYKPDTHAIVVPVKTQNANVTIFWVYPTYKTAKRPLNRQDDSPSSSLRSSSWSAI